MQSRRLKASVNTTNTTNTTTPQGTQMTLGSTTTTSPMPEWAAEATVVQKQSMLNDMWVDLLL